MPARDGLGQSVRLHVDKDILYSRNGLEQTVLYVVGDLMTPGDGKVGVDLDVQVDIVVESHFADIAFFYEIDTGDVGSDKADLSYDLAGRGGVHDLVERRAEKVNGVVDDDAGRDKGCP